MALAQYFLEISLGDPRTIEKSPSLMAASVIYLV
jgi:hypothetical protein